MTFGEKIQELRKNRGYSQRQLAAKCEISNATISRIENDSVFPEFETMVKLSDVLKVSIDYLMGKDDEPAPQYLEDAYFHFGKTAQDLQLSQEDMDLIMVFFKHHRDKNASKKK